MVEYIPFPNPRELIPPLLACLPASFASNQPPPALLPLLSPILRQRLQLLSSIASSQSDSWLRLLCWDSTKAELLQSIVESATFEPHPISGEIEITDDIPVRYKRFDEETLRSQLPLVEYNITVLYLWCPTDQEGGAPGWRVAELLPRDEASAVDGTWSASIGEANEQKQERLIEEALKAAEEPCNTVGAGRVGNESEGEEQDHDDDDYWAQYDTTPGRTPADKQSPAPHQFQYDLSSQRPSYSDASYFARYTQVQPVLDSDDPSIDRNDVGESSLNGEAVASILRSRAQGIHVEQLMHVPPYANGPFGRETSSKNAPVLLSHPRPSSACSAGSDAISKLERTAENQSASEKGVKLHIASNIKSLFRLARSTGFSRREFESIVTRELELLSLIDDDD